MATSQASATIGGTPENPILNLVLPTGPKGEPGGFTAGTSLGTANLDTITTPGLYRNVSTGATLERNYPLAGRAYVVVVYPNGSTAMQIAYPLGNAGVAETGRVFYERMNSGTSWSPWRTFASQRVDDTAGKAIYTWDDVANKEQLIYGDTGMRDVTALCVVERNAGAVYLTRTSQMVTLHLDGLKLNTSGSGLVLILPTGFRPTKTAYFQAEAVTARCQSTMYGNVQLYNWTKDLAIYGTVTYPTPDAWPTSLPGVAAV